MVIPFHNSAPKSILLRSWSSTIMGCDPVELAKRAKHKTPAMQVLGGCYTKNHLSIYNKVVQADYKWKGDLRY